MYYNYFYRPFHIHFLICIILFNINFEKYNFVYVVNNNMIVILLFR